jgi:hypothetical protein
VVPLLTRMPNPAWFAAAVGLSLVSFGIAVGVIGGLDHLMHAPYPNEDTPYFAAGFGWGTLILCMCIQPAVIEELAFRGIIFGALQKALSPVETIVVSAMMFMILHLSVGRFPHTLALGLASGYMRYRTKSIYPCMLMHLSHNLLCVLSDAMMHP